MREGQIRSADARFLAQQFVYAVIDGPARALMLSGKTAKPEQELREQTEAAVKCSWTDAATVLRGSVIG